MPSLPTPSPAPIKANYSTISTALGNTRNITTFVAAVQASGLAGTLLAYKGTIFVPSDVAFTAALRTLNVQLIQLLSNRALLVSILNYHVTPTVYATPADLAAAGTLTMLNSKSITTSAGCVRQAVRQAGRASGRLAFPVWGGGGGGPRLLRC